MSNACMHKVMTMIHAKENSYGMKEVNIFLFEVINTSILFMRILSESSRVSRVSPIFKK